MEALWKKQVMTKPEYQILIEKAEALDQRVKKQRNYLIDALHGDDLDKEALREFLDQVPPKGESDENL